MIKGCAQELCARERYHTIVIIFSAAASFTLPDEIYRI
jgi:hypothetical protein